MEEAVKESATDTQPEEERYRVRLVVEIDNRTEHKFDLGMCTRGQIQSANLNAANAFLIGPTKAWVFEDFEGNTYIFNSDHITCIKVEVR